eukprot:IDg8067t1
MSESSTDITTMSKGDAWKKYSKLLARTENVAQKDEHFTRFLLVSQTFPNQHKVPHNTRNSGAVLDDPEDVLTTMTDLLDASSKIFTDNFFVSPMYPVRILHEVAELFDCLEIDEDYIADLNLSEYEKNHKSIMTVVWLSYILGQSTLET